MNIEQENELLRELVFRVGTIRRIKLSTHLVYTKDAKFTVVVESNVQNTLAWEPLENISRSLGMSSNYDGNDRFWRAQKTCTPNEAIALKSMLTMVLSANYVMMP